MAKIKSVLTVFKNNWKKTVFGCSVLVYGANYGKEKIEINGTMRQYCKEASKLGDEWIPEGARPRHVTVILNPVANKRKAKADFEKYCAPLLHLSGISVDVLVTEAVGQARTLVDTIDLSRTDAIVVAGGDGTLSEVVTGLMRKCHTEGTRPNVALGVLPLGRTNTFAHALYNYPKSQSLSVDNLARASMTVVNGHMKSVKTLKIEVENVSKVNGAVDSNKSLNDVETMEETQESDDSPEGGINNGPSSFAPVERLKPVYSLSGLECGAFRDAKSKRDKYWYFGSLRDYAAYVFNSPSEPYCGTLVFSAPCEGCSRCYNTREDLKPSFEPAKRWWHSFIPTFSGRKSGEQAIDYSSIINNDCGTYTEIKINTVDLAIRTSNIDPNTSASSIYIGPESMTWGMYLKEGWKRIRGLEIEKETEPPIQAQNIMLWPSSEDMDRWLSIDSEDYEMKPISIVLLHNALSVLCPNIEMDEKQVGHENPDRQAFRSSYINAARSSNSFFQK